MFEGTKIVGQLRSLVQKLRGVKIPEVLSDETADEFREILIILGDSYVEMLNIQGEVPRSMHEVRIRIDHLMSQVDRDVNFFSVQVQVRILLQSLSCDCGDTQMVTFTSRTIQSLERKVLNLAKDLEKIAMLLEKD